MKHLGKFCAVVILTLSFTLSAYAGHIPCPGITETSPASEETVAGEMQNGVESTDTVTELVISLLVNILPLI